MVSDGKQLQWAVRINNLFYGNRLRLFIYTSLLGVVVPKFSWWFWDVRSVLSGSARSFTWPDFLSMACSAAMIFQISVILVATVQDEHDEAIPFTRRVVDWVRTAASLVIGFKQNWSRYSPNDRRFIAGSALIAVAVSSEAVSNLAFWVRVASWNAFQRNPTAIENLQTICDGIAAFGFFGGLGALLAMDAGFTKEVALDLLWKRRQIDDVPAGPPGASVPLAATAGPSPAPRSPAVIDATILNLSDPTVREQLLQGTQANRPLDTFLADLAEWKPRRSNHYEVEYQNDLWTFLRVRHPSKSIFKEFYVSDPTTGNQGRTDLIVDQVVAIEMKRQLSASSAQKAQGQVGGYANMWKDRGPVVLLCMRTSHHDAQRFLDSWLREQASLGKRIVVVVSEQ